MTEVTPIGSRKSDHIRINLEEDVRSGLTTGLERYRFSHRALPELDLEGIDLSQELFGRRLQAPLLVSSMTGGTDQAAEINRILAGAAQQGGIAMGLGGMNRPHRELFCDIAWGSEAVLDTTRRRCAEHRLTLSELRALPDLDRRMTSIGRSRQASCGARSGRDTGDTGMVACRPMRDIGSRPPHRT